MLFTILISFGKLSRDIVSISLGTLSRDSILNFTLKIILEGFIPILHRKKILYLFDLGNDTYHDFIFFRRII